MIHPDEIEQTSIKRQQIDRYYFAVNKVTTKPKRGREVNGKRNDANNEQN